MAITIFLALNGLAVAFLLCVVVNFWKEGHKAKNTDRKCAEEYVRREETDMIVVTYPISLSTQGDLSVIPFRGRDRYSDKPAVRMPTYGTPQDPVKRFSTR